MNINQATVPYILLIITFFIACAVVSSNDDHVHENDATDGRLSPQPNIIFLIVESTDGRTWQRGYQQDVIPLPNLRRLEDQGGHAFYRHYSNSPICCPSRASLWSGKYPHKIPHNSTLDKSFLVRGAWNNFEGLPPKYNNKIDQVLQRAGYATHLSGKQDFTTGSHTIEAKLTAWTMYTNFPYNLDNYEGWTGEMDFCGADGVVVEHNSSSRTPYYSGDWKTLDQTIGWIKNHTNQNSNIPFFVNQGMNIVHPPYFTSRYYYDQIDPTKVRVPRWSNLTNLHPCDLQATMLKGCIPTSANLSSHFYAESRRRRVRRIYYSMIAEFDSMVGEYMKAVEEAGIANNTIFIVTSDHGDMQMEHQQWYKMSPYDASSMVPLIIYDPTSGSRSVVDRKEPHHHQVHRIPTQHVDLFPTILDLAGLSTPDQRPPDLDGSSLVPLMMKKETLQDKHVPSLSPFLLKKDVPSTENRDDKKTRVAVSQCHSDDTAMSWFSLIAEQPIAAGHHEHTERSTTMKLVVYGTGRQQQQERNQSDALSVPYQLFDLIHDPDEQTNLASDPDYREVLQVMEAKLQTIVDYQQVANDVAIYNQKSFKLWKSKNEESWKDVLRDEKRRWHRSWENTGEDRALAAIEDWLREDPAQVKACRSQSEWPSSGAGDTLITGVLQ